jgi:hypothetical protein
MDIYEEMNVVLNSLDEGACIVDVPVCRIPTSESLNKLNERLSARIRENDNKAMQSFKRASRYSLG